MESVWPLGPINQEGIASQSPPHLLRDSLGSCSQGGQGHLLAYWIILRLGSLVAGWPRNI